MRAPLSLLSLAVALPALGACRRSQPAAGPTLEVRVDVPGATAVDVEASTTVPIERACAAVGQVAHVRSASEAGRSSVSVQLANGADVDAALASLRSELQRALPQLPSSATPPLVTRGRGAFVGRYVITSDVLPLAQLHEAVRAAWLRRLEATAGVGAVVTCGEAVRRVTVSVDSMALAGTGLTLGDVVAAIAPLAPLSPLPPPAEALAPIVVATVHGAPIRLRDVARVLDDASMGRCRAFGDTGALLEASVYAQPSADVREVQAALAKSLPAARVELPPAVDVRTLGAGHVLDVDLDPAVSFAGALTALRDAVRTAAGGAPFVVEIDADPQAGPARETSPTAARVVLDTSDDAAVQRVAQALATVSVVRGAGEPNATVEIVGPDRAALATAAGDLVARLGERGVPVIRRGSADRPVTVFRIDRATTTRLGVSLQDASSALEILRGGKLVSGVLVRVDGTLDKVYVRAGAGAVPLSAFVTSAVEPAPATLLREDQLPAVGVRVHATDLASLQHVFQPPPGIALRVVPEP
jgi:multidrug efflux pump subunit AcrB